MKTLSCIVSSLFLSLFLLSPVMSQGVITSDVDYVDGVDYENDKDKLDLYMPEGADDVPVIVFFHGGALSVGNKTMGQGFAQRLVPHGIGVVVPNYRLSPAVMHPAHVQDAAAAVAWVIKNIDQYGGDADNIYISGHSAGAYLATLLLMDPAYLARHGIAVSAIKGAIPIAAFLYVEETAPDRPKDVWGEEPANWLAASVTPLIDTARGRLLLIYADGDDAWRREQNDRLGHALNETGTVDVQVVEVPNRDHMSLMNKLNADDDQIGSLILEFLRP